MKHLKKFDNKKFNNLDYVVINDIKTVDPKVDEFLINNIGRIVNVDYEKVVNPIIYYSIEFHNIPKNIQMYFLDRSYSSSKIYIITDTTDMRLATKDEISSLLKTQSIDNFNL